MKKVENKKVMRKKYTPEETRSKVLQCFRAKGDLDGSLDQLGNGLLPKMLHGSKKERKEAKKTLNEEITPTLMALEVDSHWGLISAFGENYWGMAKELSAQIIKEYNCSTHAEKMLAEIIVNAFIRTLDASKELTEGRVAPGASITENRTKYIAVLSK